MQDFRLFQLQKNAARGLGGVRVAVKGLDGKIEYWEDL